MEEVSNKELRDELIVEVQSFKLSAEEKLANQEIVKS